MSLDVKVSAPGAVIPIRNEHLPVLKFLFIKWQEATQAVRIVIDMAQTSGFELSAFVEREYPASKGWVWKLDQKKKCLILIRQEGKIPENMKDSP